MHALRHLGLTQNQLASLPDILCQIRQLENFLLEGNVLTSLPANIGNLSALQKLNLIANRLMLILNA